MAERRESQTRRVPTVRPDDKIDGRAQEHCLPLEEPMTRTIRTTATVGPDGVVHLELPIGEELAGSQISVVLHADLPSPVVDEMPPHRENDAAYLAALDELHGSIDDPTFEYPTPGIYEPPPRW